MFTMSEMRNHISAPLKSVDDLMRTLNYQQKVIQSNYEYVLRVRQHARDLKYQHWRSYKNVHLVAKRMLEYELPEFEHYALVMKNVADFVHSNMDKIRNLFVMSYDVIVIPDTAALSVTEAVLKFEVIQPSSQPSSQQPSQPPSQSDQSENYFETSQRNHLFDMFSFSQTQMSQSQLNESVPRAGTHCEKIYLFQEEKFLFQKNVYFYLGI